MKMRKTLESEKKRILRKEVKFCCPICGCPVLEYHHIIPWVEIEKHLVEHMIALCPTCHALADNRTYKKQFLYELKAAGFNSPGWKHAIRLKSEDFYLKVGNIRFEKPKNVLSIDNKSMLSINRLPESNIIFDTFFFNAHNELRMSVINNELRINTGYFWDIEYNGKVLTLRHRPRTIIFQIEFNSERIWLKRGIYFFGSSIFKFFENGFRCNTGKTFFSSIDEKLVFGPGLGINVFSEAKIKRR